MPSKPGPTPGMFPLELTAIPDDSGETAMRPGQRSPMAQFATLCYSLGMANRTTVNVSLTPELDAFLQSRVKSGRYQTTSEVVREALRLLERQEQEREAGLLQLKAKLKRGAAQAERGELADGDAVFNELRELIQERRKAGKKAPRP